MDKKLSLSSSDRNFFRLVYETASTNPFSVEREELDRKIVEGGTHLSSDELFDQVIIKVLKRLKRLERLGHLDHTLYHGEDAKLIQGALLFEVYYRFTEDFDNLILEQEVIGDKSCQVPFAQDVIAMICSRGFSHDVAILYLAFFYQLRRAFHFIHYTLVGQSPCMKQLRCDLWNNVFTSDVRWYEKILWNRMEDFSTLLLGETGTGKGAAAAAIGRSGFIPFDAERGCFKESFMRNFIGINLSQFPESLIESELFGHKRGAFTGAIEDQQGVFSLCSPYGAIFLDEIGDAPIPVQIKLLQVLQERTFSPVGKREKCRFNGRVIAATNKPLDSLLKSGAFREDFYYRLCSYEITVPTLRQRIHENPNELDALLSLLIKRTLGQSSEEWIVTIKGVLHRDLGEDYAWPGNVRELEQAVRRIMLSREYSGNLMRVPKSNDNLSLFQNKLDAGEMDAQELLARYCFLLYQKHSNYETVARCVKLDRRTVKKHIQNYLETLS